MAWRLLTKVSGGRNQEAGARPGRSVTFRYVACAVWLRVVMDGGQKYYRNLVLIRAPPGEFAHKDA